MEKNAKREVLERIESKEFKKKAIKIVILEIESIPKGIDWHFIYNIPNYVSHNPLEVPYSLQRDGDFEARERHLNNCFAMAERFEEYLDSLPENERLHMVKNCFFLPFLSFN